MASEKAERTAEGWVMIDSEYHSPYWVYTVRGTTIRIESRPDDGVGTTWDRLEDAIRKAGLAGTVELLGRRAEGMGHRVIRTIPTDAELLRIKRRADERAAKYADDDCYGN